MIGQAYDGGAPESSSSSSERDWVALRQGRHGGVGLRHPAFGITLGQIYKAVESESGIFAMRSQVHEGWPWWACAMKRRLGPIFNAANDAVEQALSKTSLSDLVGGVG
jgi:DNA-binding IscR family transcriptional regulator